MQKKLITVCVPVFNEKENIRLSYERITAVMLSLSDYDYEIVYYDDGSSDGSREEIAALCGEDKRVKAVFYTRNFGYSKTVFYCMQQARGDAAVIIHCDLQNPPEIIPDFVKKWEEGADVVLGVKSSSRENKFVYFIRTLCYLIANLIFGMKLVPHSTEYELFDRSFIDVLRQIDSRLPFLRGLIREYAVRIEKVSYVQDRRTKGKSHFSFAKYYDFAVNAMVSMSKCIPRRTVFFSLSAMLACAIEFFAHFIPGASALESAVFWNSLLIRAGVFILLILMITVALMFEYIISISGNSLRKPMIVEEKRINF